jgi:FMN-dependent NADH-azoreductase
LDASPRRDGSFSRQLTQTFVSLWQQANPHHVILYRDIGTSPIPHIDEAWVAAYEAEPEQRTPQMQAAIALSDTLIDELIAADYYVFGIPMYNLTVPSSFKAYIDQIARRDRTLRLNNDTTQGILQTKKLLVITTRKFDYRPGSGREDRDFLQPYLTAIFNILNLTDITYIRADRLASALPEQQQSMNDAITAIHRLAPIF